MPCARRPSSKQRSTEVRRRFEPIAVELEKNGESLATQSLATLNEVYKASADRTAAAAGFFTIANPQLLDGAWTANASRLSELVSDYKPIADLATTYGRIEERRWRVRYRTEHESTRLDGMTAPLVNELVGEVEDVLKRVQGQTHNPTIRPPSIVHQRVIGGQSIMPPRESAD